MASTATQTGFTQEAFDSFLAGRDEPAWLTDVRRQAWSEFQRLGMPSRSDEEWMRTDLRVFHLDRFAFPGELPAGAVAPAALLSHGVDLAGHDVTLNSRPSAGEFDSALTAKGIIFGSLDRLLVERADVLRPYFDKKVINPASDKFAALHAAAWSGGSVLFVPRGVSSKSPCTS